MPQSEPVFALLTMDALKPCLKFPYILARNCLTFVWSRNWLLVSCWQQLDFRRSCPIFEALLLIPAIYMAGLTSARRLVMSLQ